MDETRARPTFVMVRLGGDSEEVIERLDAFTPQDHLPLEFDIRCKQVPSVGAGDFAFIWLGTNNNKGARTPWVQGLRALGRITHVAGGPGYNDPKTVGISVGVVLPQSLTKKDFIRESGSEYIYIADLPVIGINNYSSQVIQKVDPNDESQRLDVLMRTIDRLYPGFASSVGSTYPDLASLFDHHPPPQTYNSTGNPTSDLADQRDTLDTDIPEDDPFFNELVARVRRLFMDNFGGVILRGAPGTSKSWYARRLAAVLADRDPTRVRFVQFHPAYQYEDFVEGFVPDESGTFRLKPKHLIEICTAAANDPNRTYVLVIDELSRTDPSRVFGEALTYIEKTKRGEEFLLASGRSAVVPPNLVIIATMNVWDRGIDEVDAAVERRFASIALDPSADLLTRILEQNGVQDSLRDKVKQFFEQLQRDPNRLVRIGHAYFHSVRDESSLHRLWNHQLRFVIEKAFPLEDDGFGRIERLWKRLFPEEPAIDNSMHDEAAVEDDTVSQEIVTVQAGAVRSKR